MGAGYYLLVLFLLGAGSASALGFTWLRDAKPTEGEIRYHHLWVDGEGVTHVKRNCLFSDLERKGYAGTPQYVLDFVGKLRTKALVVTQQTDENPWHYCPSPQFVVTLAGRWYVKTGDGETLVMKPGDVLYQDNVKTHPMAEEGTRKAQHYSGARGGPCNQMVVQVDRAPEVNNPGCWS